MDLKKKICMNEKWTKVHLKYLNIKIVCHVILCILINCQPNIHDVKKQYNRLSGCACEKEHVC